MKSKEWQSTVKNLLPIGYGWKFQGTLCYRVPFRNFAFGVLAEGSGFDKGLYIWKVSAPLFAPTESIDLSFSTRIGGMTKKYSSSDFAELCDAITTALESIPAETDELRRIAMLADKYDENLRVLEVAACCEILLGNREQAKKLIKRGVSLAPELQWEQDAIDRQRRLLDVLTTGNEDSAIRAVSEQVGETSSMLGLSNSDRLCQ